MNLLLTQSRPSERLYAQLTQVLQSASSGHSCGVLTAQTRPLRSLELQDLETRLRLEQPNLMPLVGYEADAGLLTVLLPGQSLAYTHFLALTVKSFLLQSGLLTGSMAVASFPESAPASTEALEQFLSFYPDSTSSEHEIALYTGQPAALSSHTVVMVEPNENVQEFLQARLGLQGYDVHPAQDGMEGLRLIESVQPDLVITELMLPALDGYQLIHRVTQSQTVPDCPVVVLTDLGIDRDICKCFELGAADVIRKPFSPAELEARLRRLLA